LQLFVGAADLDSVCAAAGAALAGEAPATWVLRAVRYAYYPSPPTGLATIVVEPTDDLHRLQDTLIEAVGRFAVQTATPAAFVSDESGRDIQDSMIGLVANFVRDATGPRFNPHVTIGFDTIDDLDALLAEPFEAFTFSAVGAAVYQLGAFGTARKLLKALTP
jgi:hypothetical protein